MLKHIVCFKLKDNSPAMCEKTAEVLKSMDGKVNLLHSIEVGIDTLHSQRSYDIILQVVLDDMDALAKYQKDEYHCSVVKTYMHSVIETSVAIDYNI